MIEKIIKELKFRHFESSINKKTWKNHEEIYNWANSKVESQETIIEEDYSKDIRKSILDKFHLKYYDDTSFKFLIHVPDKRISPGGYSVFNNLVVALNYMGIYAYSFNNIDEFTNNIQKFKPTVILASDYTGSVNSINWLILNEFKKEYKILVGLTASADDDINDLTLNLRLERAIRNKVDFFYSFTSSEYTNKHYSFQKFYKNNFEIINFEFSANPLFHFPIKNFQKDIDFIFLASTNSDKRIRYYKWLKTIFKKYNGYIDGPGWHKINKYSNAESHKFLYSRSKIGINLHIDKSINYFSELNERTYILAASGIPQIIDNAKLLNSRFDTNSMFIANTPSEYFELFEYMLSNNSKCVEVSKNAFYEVYNKHTIFHRITSLLSDLNILSNDSYK